MYLDSHVFPASRKSAGGGLEIPVPSLWHVFEPAVHPQVLLGVVSHVVLDDVDDPGRVRLGIVAREAFQHGLELQQVAAIALAYREAGQYHGIAHAGQPAPTGGRRGGNAKEGDEDAVLQPVVLIRCIPDDAALLQGAHDAAHVGDGNGVAVDGDAALAHHLFEAGVAVRLVGGVEGANAPQGAAADLDAGGVRTEHDDALAGGDGGVQVFQAADLHLTVDLPLRAEPGGGRLQHAARGRDEAVAYQLFLFSPGEFGEGESDVDAGDETAPCGHGMNGLAQYPAQPHACAARQARQQPHAADRERGAPAAGLDQPGLFGGRP